MSSQEQYFFIYDVLRDATMCGMTEVTSQELSSSILCVSVEDPAVFTRRALEFEVNNKDI